MADSFTKLSSGILASTVWQEPSSTRIVWITMLALADKNGYVAASIPGLAHIARVSIAETEAALAAFMAPDPYSRTPDNEGRRIEAVAGGWRLLNHGIYRARRDAEDRKEQQREWDRQNRPSGHARKSESPTPSADPTPSSAVRQSDDSPTQSDTVRQVRPNPTQADTDTDTEKEQKKEQRRRGSRLPLDWQPTPEQIAWAKSERQDLDVRVEADKFRDFWAAKAGKDAAKLDWDATWRNWIRNARQQQRGPPGSVSQPPKQVQALHAILGVPHEAEQSSRVVLDIDPRGLGSDVHAEPRRLAGC